MVSHPQLRLQYMSTSTAPKKTESSDRELRGGPFHNNGVGGAAEREGARLSARGEGADEGMGVRSDGGREHAREEGEHAAGVGVKRRGVGGGTGEGGGGSMGQFIMHSEGEVGDATKGVEGDEGVGDEGVGGEETELEGGGVEAEAWAEGGGAGARFEEAGQGEVGKVGEGGRI